MLAPTTVLSQFVTTACQADPADTLLPFTASGVLAGWVKRSFAERLADWPEHFSVRPRGVGLLGHFETAEHCSAALAEVVESLAEQEVIRGWRGELITVAESFYARPLFHLERAAAHYFGTTLYATHLNGLCRRNGVVHMWLATRADSKTVDPGKLDNIAAGGIRRGHSPADALLSEAQDEAGIDGDLIAKAICTGAVRSKYLIEEGLHHEVVFVHDLWLPDNFVPKNQDGEVAGFQCLPIGEVINMLETPTRFTVDSALVIIDCLIRHGFLNSQRDDYLDLIHAMRP